MPTYIRGAEPHMDLYIQTIFATTENNSYYRIYRRNNSSTYRVELVTPIGHFYAAGHATARDAEQWAIEKAKEVSHDTT